jgi:pyruvate/2-oxoglutarate dehydrogenase complex dihydrolipoamide dehydrogenase (E3) component
MKTALIDKERLGGDCLHYGCVPSKTLLRSASVYQLARETERFGLPGLRLPAVDMGPINSRIAGVIAQIQKHDSPERFRSLGAEVFLGHAEFISPHELTIDGQTISAPRIILATGSGPKLIPVPGLEEAGFITNLDAFSLPSLPSRIVTIGAGPIGLELSQAFRRLGAAVTIVDIAPQVLPREDADMAAVVHAKLEAEGIVLRLGVSIKRVERHGSEKRLVISAGAGEDVVAADEILLAAGRTGNTEGLGLDRAGVKVEGGFVPVNSKLETSQKHILAVGDVNGQFLFTHVAGAEGSVAVRRIALHAGGAMNYRRVPWCTYTDPELASIGYNEQRAEEAGIACRVLTEPFSATDRAQAEGETEGRIKVLLDAKDRVIGTQIAGYHAGEMILPSLFAVASAWKARAVMGPIYPYPTLGELHRRTISNYMAPRLFNDRIRGILRFLFRYRGQAGEYTAAGHEEA